MSLYQAQEFKDEPKQGLRANPAHHCSCSEPPGPPRAEVRGGGERGAKIRQPKHNSRFPALWLRFRARRPQSPARSRLERNVQVPQGSCQAPVHPTNPPLSHSYSALTAINREFIRPNPSFRVPVRQGQAEPCICSTSGRLAFQGKGVQDVQALGLEILQGFN